MSDVRQDFKRSARFGLIGVVVVAVAAAAIALAFGSGGGDPTAVMAVILALVFGFVALLLYFQRRDLVGAERRATAAPSTSSEPVTDPTTVESPALLAALAVEPVDERALARASERTWGMVRESQRSGWILMVLIACAVIPWQLWQETWSIVVFVPAIVIYVVYLAVRLVMPGGGLDRAYDDSAATLAPLGLALTERPRVSLRRQPVGPQPIRHRVEGAVAYAGRRHGRSVSIRLEGGATTTLGGPVQPFEVAAKGERLRAAPGAPAAVERVLAPLRASSVWKGVEASGGPDGITVERRRGSEHWMRDLWLAERLADAASPPAEG